MNLISSREYVQFEEMMVSSAVDHYTTKAEDFLQRNSITDYIKSVSISLTQYSLFNDFQNDF